MQVTIPHQFSKAEAVSRVKMALEEAHKKLNGQATIEKEEWQGDTLLFAFTVQKQHIEGSLTVEDKAYDVKAKLPLMMRMFEGRIQKAIEEQVKAMGKGQ